MDFFMRGFISASAHLLNRWRARVCALGLVLGLLGVGLPAAFAYEPEVLQARLQRTPDAVYFSAHLKLIPTPALEEALLKGVPMYFFWQADVYRPRWYWSDKHVASTLRAMRLVYQPLTRRWRLSLSTDTNSFQGASVRYALHQNFNTLPEALLGISRISHWRVAEASRLAEGEKHRVEWRFGLDLSLLPRPFQIGIGNQPEWEIGVQRVLEVPEQADAPAQPLGLPVTP